MTGSGHPEARDSPVEILHDLAAEFEAAAERLPGERQVAEGLVAGLLATAHGDRRRRVCTDPRLRTLVVAIVLLERSLALIDASPYEAEHLALLGLFVLGRVDQEPPRPRLVCELKAGAWSLVARTRHLQGNWRALREALVHADEALAAGGYVLNQSPHWRLFTAIALLERCSDQAWPRDEAALSLLVRTFLGEAAASEA